MGLDRAYCSSSDPHVTLEAKVSFNMKNNKNAFEENVSDSSLSIFQRLLRFIKNLSASAPKKEPLVTYSLQGRFDKVDIRSRAYD